MDDTTGWQLSFREEGLHKRLRTALVALDEIRFRDLSRGNTLSVLADLLPRHSKSLTTNLIKDLFSLEDPLLLVLTVHLYFDRIVALACRHAGLSRRVQTSTFANRLDKLQQLGPLPSSLALSLRALNRLRNAFAHNLLFDLADWDPRSFTFVGTAYKREPKRRASRRQKHLLIFRIAAFDLLDDLHHHWHWLCLEDLPRPQIFRGRHVTLSNPGPLDEPPARSHRRGAHPATVATKTARTPGDHPAARRRAR
jgi:hypothetical protein